MSPQVIGGVLWALALTALGRVLLAGYRLRGSWSRWGWEALALGAAVALLFRPHEELLGGQDDGAYVNFGARFAREPVWFFRDELLHRIPPDGRSTFLVYGPERPYLSKYATGDVLRDLRQARTGFWFQPAFPVALSRLGRLFGPRAVLYGTPLFALMTAVLLRRLAAQMFSDAWAGPLAFLFYIGTPFVLWHARSPRPEIATSFFLLACACLWWRATEGARRGTWFDLGLGATCLFTAPFFHPIGWMVVVPVMGILLVAIASGRTALTVALGIAAGALALYAVQIWYVSDPYSLRGLIQAALAHSVHVAAIGGAGVLTLVGLLLAGYWRHRRSSHSAAPIVASCRVRWLAAGGLLVVYAGAYAVSRRTSPSTFQGYAYHYLYPTDLRTVGTVLSWPIVLAALVGLMLLAADSRPGCHRRWAFLVAAVPCTLATGVMWDFFMTRYLMVATAPLVALGLASLVLHVRLARGTSPARSLVAAGLLALGWRHRTHLATTVEYHGLLDFLRPFAESVQVERGLLLGEYPRLVAPFEHFFGLPTLPIPNEKLDDYRQIEEGWEAVMKAYPDRPAFFLTPYHRPISERFFFEPALTGCYRGPRLRQRRWDLPRDVEDWTVRLTLYRMQLRDAGTPSDPLPFVHEFDEGHMGLRGFTRPSTKPYDVSGMALEAGHEHTFFLPPRWASRRIEEIWAFFAGVPSDPLLEVSMRIGEDEVREQVKPVFVSWHVARFGSENAPFPAKPADRVTLIPSRDVFLADAVALAGDEAYSLVRSQPADRQVRRVLAPFPTRWARKGAQVCVPVPASRGGYLLMLVNPVGESGMETEVGVVTAHGEEPRVRTLPAQQWAWCVWRVRAREGTPTAAWFTLTSSRVYDPRLHGYPPDLIAHLGAILVVE